MRVALTQAQQQLREFAAAGREAARSGDTGAQEKAARGYETTRRQIAALTRELRINNTEVKTAERTWSGLGESVSGAASTLGKFTNVMGLVKGGLAALGISEAISKIAGGIDDFNKKMLDLNRTGQALGLDPEVIKTFRKEVEKTNGDADGAVTALAHFRREVDDARVAARNNGQALQENVRVYRGMDDAAKSATSSVVTMRGSLSDSTNASSAFVKVLRGGVQEVTKLDDPLKALGISVERYTEAQIKAGAIERDVAARLQLFRDQGKTAEANAIAFRLLGKNVDEAIVAFQALAKAAVQPAGTLDPAIKNAKAYQSALVDLETEVNKIPNEIAAGLTPLATQWLQNLTEFQKAQNQQLRDMWAATKAFWQTDLVPFFQNTQASLTQGINDFAARWEEIKQTLFAAETWSALWQSASQTAIDALNGIGKWWGDLLQSMLAGVTDFAARIGQTLSSIASSIGGALSKMATPFATGGRVPGAGTGDTVPAWLTPGEYVARRASVDYYGPRLFAALNARMVPREMFSRLGFAMGGLVGGPPMSFAGGGEVSGGRPVHLHLGGQSFALSGQTGVVDALVTEAHRQRMRSAGTKPSWYGGH